ncbi:hypothetical protein K438DRAFT_1582602 [Mycena galopus ATCC 62051]|nr:hypothetical protein K438DRAFT_1582602 [Mycena galopus ATCC 62051]
MLLILRSKTKFVLRKKPTGELISNTAHQAEREYTQVPVPEPIILFEGKSIIGTPFYVMEFVDGCIFTDTTMPAMSVQDRQEW